MIYLGPRSYVTEAFDILYDDLTECVYNTLSKKTDWWKKYIIRTKEEVFYDRRSKEEYLPEEGSLSIFREFFDEGRLIKLVLLRPDIKSIFAKTPGLVDQFEAFKEVRNDWAHRDIKSIRDAKIAFKTMIKLSNIIDATVTVNNLEKLQVKMEVDEISRNRKPCSRDILIEFIEEEIFLKNEKSPNLDDRVKGIIERSRKMLHDAETAEDVIDFYWNAITRNHYHYKYCNKHGLVTFEDLRYEFEHICYGNR